MAMVESITVVLHIFPCDILFSMDGFKSWNTISDVKSEACKKASRLGLQICPEGGDVMSGEMLYGAGSPVLLDNSTTVGSLCDNFSRYQILKMFLFPCLDVELIERVKELDRWMEECERVRMEEEAKDSGDGYSVSREMRPKKTRQLPFAQVQDLGIDGDLTLTDLRGRPGLPVSKIDYASRARTPAMVVLLAPNDRILKMLRSLPSHIKSEYLIVGMSWDILSYLFVRMVRASNPDLPFVAVTDLDPHHLDLLTFLDTPPDDLEPCYGWDLDLGSHDRSFHEIDYVDINWLGLRPFQCNPRHTSAGASDDFARPSDREFDKVIRMLKVNPHLRRKKHWLDALDWLEHHGKSVLFHPCSSADPCQSSLLLDHGFISKKLSEKDWV